MTALARRETVGVALAVMLMCGCATATRPGTTVGEGTDIRQVGRGFLVAGASEPQGYGMYSYILFPAKAANDAQKRRYISFLNAYLNLNDIKAVENEMRVKHRLDLKQLHLSVVPVTRALSNLSADNVLEAYDYVRATLLIENAEVQQSAAMRTRGGPYLICTLQPLSEVKPEERLVETLDWVPPGDLVNAWFQFFLSKAATPRDWNKNSLYQMALETQTWLENTATTVPEVQKSVMTSLVWFTGKSAETPGK